MKGTTVEQEAGSNNDLAVMSNGHSNGQHKSSQEVIERGETVITSKGVALELSGVSPILIAKLQTVGELPPVPTRAIPLDFGDGEVQYEALSEDDLQDDEERARWAEYKEKRDSVLADRNNGFMKAIFVKGVKIDMDRLQQWKDELAYFKLEVPEHPLDQKMEYIQTEAVGNTDDIADIITGVLKASGIPEEELRNVRSMFRREVRRDPAGQIVDTQREVDLEPDVYGDESGESVGSMAAVEVVHSE